MSELHPNYEICGIDISKWQIWSDPVKTIEQGVQFVIIRGGNALVKDIRYAEHRRKAEKVGLPVAFYWYWQPGYLAKDQARAMRSALHSGDQVFLDFEKNAGDNWPVAPTVTGITKAALEMVDAADTAMGDEVGIYTSPGWWAGWIARSADTKFRLAMRPLWVAQWRFSYTKKPYPLPHGWNRADVWQFSGSQGPWAQKASQFGISRSVTVDVNAYLGDPDKFGKIFSVKERTLAE